MSRFLPFAMVLILLAGISFFVCAAESTVSAEENEAREKLQELQEFIGTWEANGGPDGKKGSVKGIWKETLTWNWRFKADAAWLALDVKGGKLFKSADLKWNPEKKSYEFTALTPEGKKQVYEGTFKKDILTLERLDSGTNERIQISMNTAAEGVRMIYRVRKATGGGKLYSPQYLVQGNREGESLAAKESKQLCVVSGGAGTMPISFKGETFYVCCSGCRDAFNENPEKYIKEFKAKKK